MSAPQAVFDLIDRFELHLDSYKSGAYNETQLRREFLDPFFKLLGWDMDNEAGYAEAYKDVIHEDALRSAAAQRLGTPDYCFRIGGARKFFLEAKKPAIHIKEEITAAFQLRSYAWSAKLPLSILSDFEEFAVYDCRVKPFRNDPASRARIFYCTFAEYAEKWDHIASIFSREAVLKGSFDKFAETNKAKRGTTEVDTAFLLEIENWRKDLAENLALRNEKLTERQLNFAVQRIIDRIVFLRICEDRGTETYGRLQALVNGPRIYQRLAQLFQQADDRYNSGLFHFKPESGRHEAPDELTLELEIDDDLLRRIIKHLYYPESPYVFSFIPADILGQVYEQFLGKVITLTAGHRAKIEEKPEVRKAGGVYYTPTYIVDYIVRHTVGKLLLSAQGTPETQGSTGDPPVSAGGSPATIPASTSPLHGPIPTTVRSPQSVLNKVAKLKILDPACGSGSFLIGAYQYLLDWHLRFYLANNPEKFAKGKRPALVQTARGEWKLSIDERKRILLNNIYGVDIDSQAVEVTKLSLLLKVLEGETEQSLQPLFSIFHERALPDLGNNIKCGNSLIGADFYQQPDLPMLDEEQRYRLNVFDWHAEFAEIFKAGGFDAIIGNPPYIRSQSLGAEQRGYYARNFAAATGTYDIYVLFVERALKILSANARVGFILPNKFFTTDYGWGLRRLLTDPNNKVERIVDFEDGQVFQGAGTYTCLLILDVPEVESTQYAKLGAVFRHAGSAEVATRLKQNRLVFEPLTLHAGSDRWTIATGATGDLLKTLQQRYPALAVVKPSIFQGLKTSADKIYLVRLIRDRGSTCDVETLSGNAITLEREVLRPVVKGEHVQRYFIDTSERLHIIYPYALAPSGRALLMPEERMRREYPLTWKYLEQHKNTLGDRDRGTWRSRKDWYAYARSQNIGTFLCEKLMVPYMTTRLRVAADTSGTLFFVNITTGGYGLKFEAQEYHSNYFVALLNSKLMDLAIRQLTNQFRGGYFAVNKQALERLPFRRIDFSKPAEKARHDHIVDLVEQIVTARHGLVAVKTPHEKTALERQIAATDKQIDALVYELYGLTEEEIAIVEGKTTTAASDAWAASVSDVAESAPQPTAPSEPSSRVPNPEQAWADSAHYYSVKEEPAPYRIKSNTDNKDDHEKPHTKH